MKYDKKFPYAEYLDEVFGGIFKGHGKRPCFICGELTEFVDMDYQAHLCSEECSTELDQRALKACLESAVVT